MTEAEMQDEVGVATAMAWTENGGEIMLVEVLLLDGKGNLQVTGQIGEIMQESAQAAHSYVKSLSREHKIDPRSMRTSIFTSISLRVQFQKMVRQPA